MKKLLFLLISTYYLFSYNSGYAFISGVQGGCNSSCAVGYAEGYCSNYGSNFNEPYHNSFINYCDYYIDTTDDTPPSYSHNIYVKFTCYNGYYLGSSTQPYCILDNCSQNQVHNPSNLSQCCDIGIDQCGCPENYVIGADSECYLDCSPVPVSNPNFYNPPSLDDGWTFFSNITTQNDCQNEASNYPIGSDNYSFNSDSSGNCNYYACWINTFDPCVQYPDTNLTNPNSDIWTFLGVVSSSLSCSAKVDYINILDSYSVPIQELCETTDKYYCYVKYNNDFDINDTNTTPPNPPNYCNDCPSGYSPDNNYTCFNNSNPSDIVSCGYDPQDPPDNPPLPIIPPPSNDIDGTGDGTGSTSLDTALSQSILEEIQDFKNQNNNNLQNINNNLNQTNQNLQDINDRFDQVPTDIQIDNKLNEILGDLNTSLDTGSLSSTMSSLEGNITIFNSIINNILQALDNFEGDFNTVYNQYNTLMSTIDNNLTNVFSVGYDTLDTCPKTFTFDVGFADPIDFVVDPCVIVSPHRDFFYLIFWFMFNVLFLGFAFNSILKVF
jgi:hypothetical protein